MRFHDAIPRCSMLVTQPNAIIGQLSIMQVRVERDELTEREAAAITSRLPIQSTSSAPRPEKQRHAREEDPLEQDEPRLRRRYSSFARRKRSSSAASCR